MERLCKQLHIINVDHDNVKVFMTGMVYNVDEFKNGGALVNSIWAPNYIFDTCEINEMDNRGRD